MSNSESIQAIYGRIRPQYEAFTLSLDALVRALLTAHKIEFFAVEPRTKSIESFEEKIHRDDKNGKYSAVSDVTDLTGIRIITYLQEDSDKISEIIEQSFEVDKVNSVNKEDELDPDKFGYLSTHYVISLKDDRTSLAEFSPFSSLKAEIQVRTLLQHTWASIDWKFRYKEDREAPRALRRRLYRISALLEAADNEFSAVKVEIDQIRKQYADEIVRGDLDIKINTESLRSFVDESETVKTIFKHAEKVGISIRAEEAGKTFNYGRLAGTVEILGINNLGQLDDGLRAIIPEADRFFPFLSEKVHAARGGKRPIIYGPALLRYVLMRFASPPKRKVINQKYKPAEGYDEAVAEYSAAN